MSAAIRDPSLLEEVEGYNFFWFFLMILDLSFREVEG
jgi:hypothetical protein